MKFLRRVALAVGIGLVAALIVITVWVPVLQRTGHVASFGMTQRPPIPKLDEWDFRLICWCLCIQGPISAFCALFDLRWLIPLQIAFTPLPWLLIGLWALLSAPTTSSFNVYEMFAWLSQPLILNLLVFVQVKVIELKKTANF